MVTREWECETERKIEKVRKKKGSRGTRENVRRDFVVPFSDKFERIITSRWCPFTPLYTYPLPTTNSLKGSCLFSREFTRDVVTYIYNLVFLPSLGDRRSLGVHRCDVERQRNIYLTFSRTVDWKAQYGAQYGGRYSGTNTWTNCSHVVFEQHHFPATTSPSSSPSSLSLARTQTNA